MMAPKITAFLMFAGQAEAAVNFYVSLFPQSRIVQLRRYSLGEAGVPGAMMHATIVVAGQRIICVDSPVKHAFTFTPAMSLFVACESDTEIERLYIRLCDGGQVMMPLDSYPFSARFAWLSDRFGVSWQLSLGAR